MKRCVVARRLRSGERERPISGSVCVSAVNGDGGLLRVVRDRGVLGPRELISLMLDSLLTFYRPSGPDTLAICEAARTGGLLGIYGIY